MGVGREAGEGTKVDAWGRLPGASLTLPSSRRKALIVVVVVVEHQADPADERRAALRPS